MAVCRAKSYAREVTLFAIAGVVSTQVVVGTLRAQAVDTAASRTSQRPPDTSFDGLQTSAAKAFEVATVKLNISGDPRASLGPPGHGRVSIENVDLHKIIASSFRIQDSMVFGPEWLNSTYYNVVGKGADPGATNGEVWEMMRSLLADRFKLKYHIESREMPIYVLSVAKSGPKLNNPETGRCAADIKAAATCGDLAYLPFGVEITNMPIGALVTALGRRMQDRPIVDKTGLTGKYDVKITWVPDVPAGGKALDLERIPKEIRPEDESLFQAVERQAGLKLEATKGPIQVVVIDSIEKPSEN